MKKIIPLTLGALMLGYSLTNPKKANAEISGTFTYQSHDPIALESSLDDSGFLNKINPDSREGFIRMLSDDLKRHNTKMEASYDLKPGDKIQIYQDKNGLTTVKTKKQGSEIIVGTFKLLPPKKCEEEKKKIVNKSLEKRVKETENVQKHEVSDARFYLDKEGNIRIKQSFLGIGFLNPNDVVLTSDIVNRYDKKIKLGDVVRAEATNYIAQDELTQDKLKEARRLFSYLDDKSEIKLIDALLAKTKKEEKYEVAKSTAIKPSKISVGVIYSAGKPVNLVGISTEYGSKKAGIGTSIAVSQGKAILEQETVPGTRFNAYGEKTYSNAMEIAADARLGPFKLGYAIELGEMNTDEKILNKTGDVLASNNDTYMNKDGKIRCGLQFGLGKNWYLNASRDLTGTNKRTTFGIIKRLGGYNRTTHK